MVLTVVYSSKRGINDLDIEIEFQKTIFPSKATKLSEVKQKYIDKYDYYSLYEFVYFKGITIHNIDGIGLINYKDDEDFIKPSEYDFIFLFIFIVAIVLILISFVDYYLYSNRKYDIRIYEVFN